MSLSKFKIKQLFISVMSAVLLSVLHVSCAPTLVITIPPIRDRVEDIPELVHYFLKCLSVDGKAKLTPEAMHILQCYSWPGNVRQLRAAVESLASKIDGNLIREKDVFQVLPEAMSILTTKSARRLIGGYGAAVVMNERDRFEKAIIKAKGDRSSGAVSTGDHVP